MKKHSRIISMLLAIMMFMTSLSIVFAVDGPSKEPQNDDSAVATGGTSLETGLESGDTKNEEESSVIDELVEGLERPSITVKINYVDEFGKIIVDPVTKEIFEPVTQEIELVENSEGVYEGHYSVESPKVAGYAADKEVVEGAVNNDSLSPTIITVTYTAAPADPVTNFKLHPAYNSIILTWDRVDDAKAYVIQRSTTQNGIYTDLATVQNTSGKEIVYTDKTANGVNSSDKTATIYYYKVLSVSWTDIMSDKPAMASNTCVRPMYEKITFKEGVTLTSHDGKNKSIYFRRGQEVTAQGFNGGKYEFWYNGYYFTANFARMKNQYAVFQRNDVADGVWYDYSGKWGLRGYASAPGVGDNYYGIKFYDKISAENFVNASGQSSSTGYLIWVSTYTQHLYMFQGSKGKWKLTMDWECSTGAASSPTPTGFNKRIEGHKSYDDRIPYWCNFQTANSIHGHRSSYTFGSPQSNGCVRNYNDNAWTVYTYCPMYTAVIIY